MKIGFIFPGQGSQSMLMGKDLYDSYEEVKEVYESVKRITGIDVAKLTFESDEETLSQTKNTQIAILTMSLGILKLLEKESITAEVSAGLSLGEYTALIYSKAISFETGVKLVKNRGEYMQNMLPAGEWSMVALLGADENTAKEICEKVSNGFVVPANYNCVGQIAISGEKDAVAEAMEIAKNYDNVKKVVQLKTSGPFHTNKLKEAAEALKKDLDGIKFNKFNCNVVKNIDGEVYKENDDIKDILYNQMINPIRFDKCIETMIRLGVDTFVEIGPGKTLSSFVKRTSKDVNVFNINNIDSLKLTIEKLKI